MTRTTTALAGLIATVLLGAGVAGGSIGPTAAGATAPASVYSAAATFTGPITTGHVIDPLSVNPIGLGAHDYVQQEFFAAGVATAFTPKSEPSDGKWTIAPSTTASYRTRILVRRPQNPAHFNGNVVVEWMNVSAGESAPDWDYLNPLLMQAGDAYVAVSVQRLGVDGGTPILGAPGGSANATSNGGLVGAEPARYGTLHQPGDQYALDIYAQIGQALHHPKDHVLGPLQPKHILALGESQSAFYLTTFADALQPVTHTFDGLFIHSRAGTGASLSGPSITSGPQGPDNLHIRTDLSVPVFMFETQTDLIQLGYAAARQPNTARIRTWQVAGTSHADAYEVGGASGLLGCTTPVNDGPQHTVAQAAFAAFTKWVDDGTPPPSPAPFQLSSTAPATLALDSHGNVIGGVRTPAVDVPVSTLTGVGPAGASELCSLFGSAVPFSPSTLTSLYQTKSHYLAAYTASLDKAIKGGYILGADRATLLAQAQQVPIPS
jgi:hypothetical protein